MHILFKVPLDAAVQINSCSHQVYITLKKNQKNSSKQLECSGWYNAYICKILQPLCYFYMACSFLCISQRHSHSECKFVKVQLQWRDWPDRKASLRLTKRFLSDNRVKDKQQAGLFLHREQQKSRQKQMKNTKAISFVVILSQSFALHGFFWTQWSTCHFNQSVEFSRRRHHLPKN